MIDHGDNILMPNALPTYYIFAETRAMLDNSTDPQSIGSHEVDALRAVEHFAHMLSQGAELIVCQRKRLPGDNS